VHGGLEHLQQYTINFILHSTEGRLICIKLLLNSFSKRSWIFYQNIIFHIDILSSRGKKKADALEHIDICLNFRFYSAIKH